MPSGTGQVCAIRSKKSSSPDPSDPEMVTQSSPLQNQLGKTWPSATYRFRNRKGVWGDKTGCGDNRGKFFFLRVQKVASLDLVSVHRAVSWKATPLKKCSWLVPFSSLSHLLTMVTKDCQPSKVFSHENCGFSHELGELSLSSWLWLFKLP